MNTYNIVVKYRTNMGGRNSYETSLDAADEVYAMLMAGMEFAKSFPEATDSVYGYRLETA